MYFLIFANWMLTHAVIFPGWTSLMFASHDGHAPLVKLLLEHKANIETKNKSGMFLNSATAVLFCVQVHGGCVCLWMLMCVWLM